MMLDEKRADAIAQEKDRTRRTAKNSKGGLSKRGFGVEE